MQEIYGCLQMVNILTSVWHEDSFVLESVSDHLAPVSNENSSDLKAGFNTREIYIYFISFWYNN